MVDLAGSWTGKQTKKVKSEGAAHAPPRPESRDSQIKIKNKKPAARTRVQVRHYNYIRIQPTRRTRAYH
jgi:hypothetical protein